MGEDDNFNDKKKPHKSKHSGKMKILVNIVEMQ